MEKYCRNCGNRGHLYSECFHPIISLGIILYCDKDNSNEKEILMIERKDSLAYIEFLRGKYKHVNNHDYIQLLIDRMNIAEKENLLVKDFDSLWNELWIYPDKINSRIKREYYKSKNLFDSLNKNEKNINYFVSQSKTNYFYNEWEIPKGRREKNENDIMCAIREVKEETNIDINDYDIIRNIIPLEEEYTGINKVRYKHIYYIGKITGNVNLYISDKNKEQHTEIKRISWLNQIECLEKIRDHDEHKKKIINDFFEFINSYEKYGSLEK